MTRLNALVAGLDLAKAAKAASVVVYCDFQVIINQVNDNYECKRERMKKYLEQAQKRVDDLQAKIVQIPTSVVVYCDFQVVTNK